MKFMRCLEFKNTIESFVKHSVEKNSLSFKYRLIFWFSDDINNNYFLGKYLKKLNLFLIY